MNEQCIYLIKHISSGLVKIGITKNWPRRCTELSVGLKCEIIKAVFCDAAQHYEKKIHFDLDSFRLPQSEWFHLNDEQIAKLTQEISLLGKENKWRLGQPKKRQTKAQKTFLLLPETEVEGWIHLLASSLYVSYAEAYSDGIVIYGLETKRDYDGTLLPVSVGTIIPEASGVVFSYIKIWRSIGSEYEKCQDIFELLRRIENQYYILSSQKPDRLLLPTGAKIKWRMSNLKPIKELQDELESYFSATTGSGTAGIQGGSAAGARGF